MEKKEHKEYIEREAAINTVYSMISKWDNGDPDDLKNMLLLAYQELPSADVRPVARGRWKLHDDGSGTCSVCGFRQKAVWDMDNAQNYCGHCGAEMEDEDG